MPASLLTVTPLTASGISHVFDNIPYSPVAWYDATKIAGISSGASLSVWTDSSGNGNHARMGSVASQPTYRTGELNSIPAVRFDTAGSGMTAFFTQAMPCTIAAVAMVNTGGVICNLMATPNPGTLDRASANSFRISDINVKNIWTTAVSANSAPHVFFSVFSSTGTLRVDGASNVTSSAGMSPSNATGITIGSLNGFSSTGTESIAEILVYPGVLSATQQQMIEAYLSNKYSITIT